MYMTNYATELGKAFSQYLDMLRLSHLTGIPMDALEYFQTNNIPITTYEELEQLYPEVFV